jgi:hypothetical protein
MLPLHQCARYIKWQGKVSVNITNAVIHSINTQIEFLFSYRYMVRPGARGSVVG